MFLCILRIYEKGIEKIYNILYKYNWIEKIYVLINFQYYIIRLLHAWFPRDFYRVILNNRPIWIISNFISKIIKSKRSEKMRTRIRIMPLRVLAFRKTRRIIKRSWWNARQRTGIVQKISKVATHCAEYRILFSFYFKISLNLKQQPDQDVFTRKFLLCHEWPVAHVVRLCVSVEIELCVVILSLMNHRGTDKELFHRYEATFAPALIEKLSCYYWNRRYGRIKITEARSLRFHKITFKYIPAVLRDRPRKKIRAND